MNYGVSLDDLRGADFGRLVEVFKRGPQAPFPTGVWRGHWLMPWPDRPAAFRVLNRGLFQVTPNGLDLDRKTWWFGHPRLRIAKFETSLGPSRFVPDSDIVRLDYGRSRMPLHEVLYDEVLPLTPHMLLGLGAINREVGVGEQFLFALTPMAPG